MPGAAVSELSDRLASESIAARGRKRDTRGLYAAAPVVASLLVGIALYRVTPLRPMGYAGAAAAAALLALLLHRLAAATWLLVAGFGLVGLSGAQCLWFTAPRGDIVYYTAEAGSLARLRLRVEEVPRGVEAEGYRPAATYARARVEAIRCRKGWQAAGGVVLLRVSGNKAAVALGEEIEALGSLYRVDGPGNPGEFDLQEYQRLRGVYARFSCEAGAVESLAKRGEGWLDRARRKVREALDRGFSPARADDLALAKILILGDSDPSLGEVREDFRRTGTTHHLAISGTHIAVLTMFVFFVCRVVRLHPARAAMVAMLFALAYGLVVVPSPPVTRSVLLCLAIGIGLMLRRRVKLVQLLALSATVMLCWDPLDAFDPGFQLSFGCVLGLMLLATPLAITINELESEHVRIARKLRPPVGRAAAAMWIREQGTTMLAAGAVAWLVSMPLIAWHFRQLNPWAVPASILLGFVVAMTLIAGFFKVILTLVAPWMAPALAAPLATFASWMRELVHAMAAVPATDAAVYPMPWWTMVVYYLLLALPLWPMLRERRAAWLAPLLAGVLAAVAPLVAMGSSHAGGPSRLSVLSVGAGSCAVLESRGATIMVDAGSLSPATGERIIEPFLRYSDLRQVDALYLTHGDLDHVSEAERLLEHGRVGMLAVAADAKWTQHLRAVAAQYGVAVREVRCGDVLEHGAMRVTVAGPGLGVKADNSNDSSLVLLVEAEGKRVLFTGDIGEKPRREMAEAKAPVRADILLAPHHGSVTQWTREFIERSGARVIVSSDAWRLSAAQKKLPELTRERTLYRTGQRGAVCCEWQQSGEVRTRCFR